MLPLSLGEGRGEGETAAACDTMPAANSDAGFVNYSATTRPFTATAQGERTAHQRTTRRQP